MDYSRRLFVAAAGALLSGCVHEDGGEGDAGGSTDGDTDGDVSGSTGGSDTSANRGEDDGDGADTSNGTVAEDDDALDLREANVTGVSVEGVGEGRYRFDVTLYHDDDGEDGYADWWQVEGLDGARLGRRDLLHPHGTRRFTRSATVETGDKDCVVVRGHDQTHGYGGRAAVVNPETGEVRAYTQGAEASDFDARDCR